MKTTNLKGVMKNQDIKGSFFENLDNAYIQMLFVGGKRVLLVAFIRYIYCTQNCRFYYFLETNCEKKLFNIF